MSLKSLSIVRRVAVDLFAIFDEMWFLTTGPMVVVPWSSQSFPSERTPGVSSRSITVTSKSNSRTYTVASSFVSTSPLAVATVVGFLETFAVSKSAELRSFLLTMCILAPESTTNCPSSGFIVDAARRKECSFVLFFELKGILGKSPYISAGASLLSFSLLLRPILKFHSVGTALMRNFDLNVPERRTLFFLGCLLDAAQLLWIVLVELVPRFLGPSQTSRKILAARRPAIRNPTVEHLSLLLLHFCHHPSSTFWLFLNLPVRKRALCAEFAPRFWLIKLTFGKLPTVTK